MQNRVPLFTAFAMCLLACPSHADEKKSDKDVQAGEAIYMQRCASCHGKNLQGGNAQSMVDGVWQFGGDDGSIFRNIKFGISAVGMPDYQAALSDDEVRQVMKFMKAAQDRQGVERPPLPELLQTRHYDVGVEKWIDSGLDIPWSLVFIDSENALVTERPGRLRQIENGKLLDQPISGIPKVLAEGQGGLLDVAIDPDHAENGWVYLSYSHALDGREGRDAPAMTRIVRGKIQDGEWTDHQVVFEAADEFYNKNRHHYGSRLAFDSEGRLYFSVGDRGADNQAQDPHWPTGKIHRVWPDGTIPDDNPFADGKEGLPSVFAYGNRNPQGLATHPTTGDIWETEHGPMGGDEVNLVRAGVNYGWPRATYGINYNGTPVSDNLSLPGMQPPVLYWVPSIATCGATFCSGEEFPRWASNLLVGGLSYEELRRLVVADGRVIHQETVLKNAGRVRAVACDPSGAIYVVLNKPDMIVKLTNNGAALRQ